MIAVGSAALLATGVLAGSVVGDDGANEISERLAGDFGEPAVELASPASGGATAAGKRRRARKPKVQHGTSSTRPLAAGEEDGVDLKCPRKFPVPLSAGLATSIPGIFPGFIARSPDTRRAMRIFVTNATGTDGSWAATIACAKGVKEV